MSQTYSNEKFVKIWLFASIILVYLMILVGGITRLTDPVYLLLNGNFFQEFCLL